MELLEALDELAADENWAGYLILSGVSLTGRTEPQYEKVMWYEQEGLYTDSDGVEFGKTC